MENIAYIGLSNQIALKQKMTVTANNIANMSTPGFKAQDVLFNEYKATPQGGEAISQVVDRGSYRRMDQGPISATNNPLDVAIQGDGFFSVQADEGTRYTRAGNFTLNNQGQIITQSGHPVLDTNAAPITIPEGETHITITASGQVSTKSGEVGQIGVFKFENDGGLLEVGQNLYSAGEEEAQAAGAGEIKVLQGMVENSNVQPIVEMNKMIEILRQYQSMQNIIKTDHDRQRGAISKLTQNA